MTWDEIEMEAAGLRMAARCTGPATAPPVLALHGWLDNAASFDRLAPLVPDVRWIALDLPGHGLSGHREAGNPYSFIDGVAAVSAARDALGIDACLLLGHSLGAAIAAFLAGAQPARATGLVLLDGMAPLVEAPELAAERLGRALDEQRTKLGRRPPVYPDRQTAIARLSGAFSGLSPGASEVLCSRGLTDVDGGVTWRSDPQVRWQSRSRMVEAQVVSILRAIACPTLLVRASRGLLGAAIPTAERIAVMRDIEVLDLPGSHHVHLEEPELVAPAVARFFARVAAPR
jgi:pimeloyl-ACP methyl ester carboxylesterase